MIRTGFSYLERVNFWRFHWTSRCILWYIWSDISLGTTGISRKLIIDDQLKVVYGEEQQNGFPSLTQKRILIELWVWQQWHQWSLVIGSIEFFNPKKVEAPCLNGFVFFKKKLYTWPDHIFQLGNVHFQFYSSPAFLMFSSRLINVAIFGLFITLPV
jgi:hypothetical protein